MQPTIRPLDPHTDLSLVEVFYAEAADYWRLADRCEPDTTKAAAFFTDCPPGCEPSRSHRLGLFADDRLCGVAELSFGFPEPDDAYLGLMLLAPRLRGQGLGAALLAHVEDLARKAHAPRLYLAVLDENARGRTFWARHGFQATGVRRSDDETRHWIERMVKPL